MLARVVQTICYAVFPSAREALCACRRAPRAPGRWPWSQHLGQCGERPQASTAPLWAPATRVSLGGP
eukprot:7054486-Pyramimonas_sp.AAC.1